MDAIRKVSAEDEEFQKSYQQHGDLWYYQERVAVPYDEELRNQILKECHMPAERGHLGVDKTLERVARHFYWPHLRRFVTHYIKHCVECQRNKSDTRSPPGLLQTHSVPEGAWDSITMDFLTGLPKSKNKNDAIWVLVDRLTKGVYYIPLKKTTTAPQLADIYLREVYPHEGLPREIISDRDPKFRSQFWRSLWKSLGTTLQVSTAAHPETDGQTERANRTLCEMLRSQVNDAHSNWEEKLPLMMMAYNDSQQASTGFTPFFLKNGRHPRTALSTVVPSNNPAANSQVEAIREAITKAKANIAAAQERQRKNANLRRREAPTFAPGDRVLLSTKDMELQFVPAEKLGPKYIGPFKVLQKMGPVTYKLEFPKSMKIHNVIHVRKLKAYHEPIEPEQRHERPPPTVDEESGDEEFEIEKILTHRDRSRGKGKTKIREYYVKFRGYPEFENMWLAEKNVFANRLVAAYWKRVKNGE